MADWHPGPGGWPVTRRNSIRLKNQVALITGAGRGIGQAIALRFAQEGAALMLASRTEAELEATAKRVAGDGGRAAFLAGDVSQEPFVAELVKATEKQLGAITILVNNAGVYGGLRPLVEVRSEEWDEVMALNLRSAFLLIRTVLPGMIERGRGVILNISSVAGKLAFPWSHAYAASKAGLLALTRTAAAEASAQGVRVNALCPGSVEGTAMWEEVRSGLQEKLGVEADKLSEQIAARHLLGRTQTPEEVATTALFLCSADASAITGQAVNVDGGLVFY